MTELIICRGLPASGKTRWTRRQIDKAPAGTLTRVNRDDLRTQMCPTGYRKPIPHYEVMVTTAHHAMVESLLRHKVNVIVDDTNLRVKAVRDLVGIAQKTGASWTLNDTFLDVPPTQCLEWDSERENPVGPEVIRSFYDRYLSGGRALPVPEGPKKTSWEPYRVPLLVPEAIMVDIDGTVALHGDRDPYDPSKYHLDQPNLNIRSLIYLEISGGAVVLFCSGRDEAYREVTEEWIEANVIPSTMRKRWRLYMRPEGDTRNDAIVKMELFDKHIRHSYAVRRVYDDRDRVVAAWRSIGLTCLQVAEGAF